MNNIVKWIVVRKIALMIEGNHKNIPARLIGTGIRFYKYESSVLSMHNLTPK